ncbi:CvpA family protein [Robertkochia aurantiaca]|uniref:CvpA family protein n=1 Tax=Robertkochia aurantiaca TaxID=2873700 RepID=UPI001CC91B77|nr:CvpA family protein [Robertkochia sp. 3YJGBD-33]
MNFIDIVMICLIAFGLVKGIMKGLFVEVASLLGLILGVYGAIHFSHFTGSILKDHVSWDEATISLSAFALTFMGIVVAVALAGKILTKIADFAALGLFNKILGGLFGAAKITLLLAIIILFFERMNQNFEFVEKNKLSESVMYVPVRSIGAYLFESLLDNNLPAASDFTG